MSNESQERAYSASFRLYDPAGLQILFTVRADDGLQHIANIEDYLQELSNRGFSVNLPGTEPGEKIEEIDAWVRGETTKGDPCVFLYSGNPIMKWKVETIYVERLDEMPFNIGSGQLWPGQAPERQTAEAKGYLNTVTPFKIVLKQTGKTSQSGNPIMKFDRLLNPIKKDLSGNGNGQEPDQDWPEPTALTDDQKKVFEATAKDYIRVVGSLHGLKASEIKSIYKEMGINAISGNPLKRLADYNAFLAYIGERGLTPEIPF